MFIFRFYQELRRGFVIVSSTLWLLMDLVVNRVSRQSYFNASSGFSEKPSFFRLVFIWILKIIIRFFYNYQPEGSFPEEFRKTLARLGPAYVKLGQVLSLRGDLLPENITHELSKLQNRVPAFEFSQVKKVISTELGKDISDIFKSFSEKPIAAGSLGQVHLAELKNGQEVAVKVQRPGIQRLILQDITIIGRFVSLLERWSKLKHYRLTAIINEFKASIVLELDFEQEGRNLDQFINKFSEQRYILFPKVFWNYTSKKVLTMQYVEGINLEGSKDLREKGINVKKLSYVGTRSILKMLFVDGFFHADPHPGNITVIGRSRICFFDVGMVGYLSEKVKYNLLLYLYLLITGKYEQAARYLLKLTTYGRGADVVSFENELARILRNWYFSGFTEYSLGRLTLNVMQLGAKYRLYFSSELVLAMRAVLTAESVGKLINPDADIHRVMQPMIRRLFKDFVNLDAVVKEVSSNWPEYLISLRTLPQNVLNFLDLMSSSHIPVETSNSSVGSLPSGSQEYSHLPILSGASMVSGTIALASSSTPGPLVQLMANFPEVSSLSLGFFSLGILFMLRYFSQKNK